MLELTQENTLKFSFPEVHQDAVCKVSLQRTLRIPDDNQEYPLPPGFGEFPLEHVEDHAPRLPEAWVRHGGVLLPIHQAEALWINFSAGRRQSCPMAIKIAAGKINAITGGPWTNELSDNPQDYMVVPDQPWLDGFCIADGLVRQFVAMPLGMGYTAEEQLTGESEHGGLQVIVYPMKKDRYAALVKAREEEERLEALEDRSNVCCMISSSMGLAAGGLMRQKVYEDDYGIEAWDQTQSSRCFVHLLNSDQWKIATGKPAPPTPISAEEYTMAGMPWFDYYAEGMTALPGAKALAELDSVAAKGIKTGQKPLMSNESLHPSVIIKIGSQGDQINDGVGEMDSYDKTVTNINNIKSIPELVEIISPFLEKDIRNDPFTNGYDRRKDTGRCLGIVNDWDRNHRTLTTEEEFLDEEQALKAAEELAIEYDLCVSRYSISTESVFEEYEDPELEDPEFDEWVNEEITKRLEDPVKFLLNYYLCDKKINSKNDNFSNDDIPFN